MSFATMDKIKRLESRIRELEAQLKTAEAALRKAHDALIWCSGASDFNPDGKAREGWIKIALPAFEVISSALCNEAQAKGGDGGA